jgi:DNA-binding CsgD family transcriptional regulator
MLRFYEKGSSRVNYARAMASTLGVLKMSQSLSRGRTAEKANAAEITANCEDIAVVPPDVLSLTPQERLVCAMLVRGMNNKAIAARLDAGLRTVEMYRSTAARKLSLVETPLIVWAALHQKWLPDVPPAPKQLTTVSSPAAKAPPRPQHADPTPREIADPTPEEIAQRALAIRREWAAGNPSVETAESEGGELCFA